MNLVGSLTSKDRFDELLATVLVRSDTATPCDIGTKRKIHGVIQVQGSLWNDYVQFWQQPAWTRHDEDGRSFFPVNCLQVNFDFYGLETWMNIAGNEVRLILFEGFEGTEAEYYQEVKRRNSMYDDFVAAWNKEGLTRNDYRELRGMPKRDTPFFNELLPKNDLESAKQHFLHPSRLNEFRNYV